MAGGGLDDELLALAGDSDNEHKGSRKQVAASSDDDHAPGGSSVRKRSGSKPSSSLAKKRRLDLLDESGEDSDRDAPGSDIDAPGSSDEDEAAGQAYTYQGIYKNAEDMEQLLAMNELEREDILARRRDEQNKRRQKVELAALVRAQKAAAGATQSKSRTTTTKKALRRGDSSTTKSKGSRKARRGGSDSDDDVSDASSDEEEQEKDADSDFEVSGAASAAKNRKKKAPGATDTKSAKLNELKNRRKEKAAGVSRSRADSDDDGTAKNRNNRRGYASSSEEEEGGVSYSDTDEEIYGRSKYRKSKVAEESTSASKEPPSLDELNAARVSRDTIEQRLYAPRWKETLTDAFIRFSWGRREREDGQGREEVYRIHQITDVVEKPGKFYDLSVDGSGRWTNVYIVFEHNNSEYDAKLSLLSRSDFTEGERERWLRTLSAAGLKIPRASNVINKADALEKFFTSPLTESDIGRMLEHKKRLKREAISVMGSRATNQSSPMAAGDSTPMAGFDSPLPGLGRASQIAPASLEAKLASMNERNRAAAKSKISDVERRSRAAAKLNSVPLPVATTDNASANGHSQGSDAATPIPALQPTANGFVTISNLASTVEIDLGDF